MAVPEEIATAAASDVAEARSKLKASQKTGPVTFLGGHGFAWEGVLVSQESYDALRASSQAEESLNRAAESLRRAGEKKPARKKT